MNREALKVCPFCASAELEPVEWGGDHLIWCNACLSSGPAAKSKVEAIDKWNAALRSLVPDPSLPCRHLEYCESCNPKLKERT